MGKSFTYLVNGGLISALIAGVLVSAFWFFTASACCYDPPEPEIIPDPPAVSVAPDVSASTVETTSSEEETQSTQAERKDEKTPIRLLEKPISRARSAMANEEWLKARIIILDAQEIYGAEPELRAMMQQIEQKLGLDSLLQTPQPNRTTQNTAISGEILASDPLAKALDQLQIIRTE